MYINSGGDLSPRAPGTKRIPPIPPLVCWYTVFLCRTQWEVWRESWKYVSQPQNCGMEGVAQLFGDITVCNCVVLRTFAFFMRLAHHGTYVLSREITT